MSKHPFLVLSDLIKKYSENKDSFDVEQLQTMREDISLQLFYLADSVGVAISNYDMKDWERKRNYSELIEKYRQETDEDGKKYTVAVVESKARIENKEKELEVCEALRQKEKIRLIVSSTTHILHAISSRLNIIDR